jgi:hypothetical protein
MDLTYKTWWDHNALLRNRGYNESQLGGGYKAGEIQEMFFSLWHKAAYAAFVEDKITDFTLRLKGSFNGGMDKVNFRVLYEVNPWKRSMRIWAVVAEMGIAKKIYLMTRSGRLESPYTIYEDLVQLRIQKRTFLLVNKNGQLMGKRKSL